MAPQAPERAGEGDSAELVRVLELVLPETDEAALERGSIRDVAFAGPLTATTASRRRRDLAALGTSPRR